MRPILSILIPTVEERKQWFDELIEKLQLQTAGLRDEIEIISICDNKEMTIGEKRNRLYQKASGEYSVQIDDDDYMGNLWVSRVFHALESKPDCVTYQEYCLIDGRFYSSNHSLKYADWWENVDGFDYVRTPFFKDVIKTEICQSIPVPHIRYGEDHQYARLIKPLLKTEIHIDEYLYYYIHNSSNPTERYGLDRD